MPTDPKIVLLFLMVLFSACSSVPVDKNRFKIYDDYAIEKKLDSVTDVKTFKFQGWNSLDSKHLIVSSYQSQSYLLTLANYCNDLDFTNSIVIDQSIHGRLNTKFDSIIVPGQHQQKCKIKYIHILTKEQRNELTSLRKNQVSKSTNKPH